MAGKSTIRAELDSMESSSEESNSVGNHTPAAVVASGTLVSIKPVYKSEFDKSNFIRKELYVRNYYDLLVPRASKVVLASEGKGTKVSVWFNNYNNDDILALKAELQFTNIYGDNITLPDVDFTFDKTNLNLLKSDFVECKLPDRYIKLISSAKVYIKKYVKSTNRNNS